MDNEITKDVNPHFEDFIFDWLCKFYLLCGGYGSSKSYHIALKLILKCIEEKREYYRRKGSHAVSRCND